MRDILETIPTGVMITLLTAGGRTAGVFICTRGTADGWLAQLRVDNTRIFIAGNAILGVEYELEASDA